MNKLLTIVIPLYNRDISQSLGTIETEVKSLDKRVSIIVVDDGSEHEISASNKNWISNAISIGVLTNDQIEYKVLQNSGALAARWYGTNASDSKFITYLDSDDTFDWKLLTKWLGTLETSRNDLINFAYMLGGKIFTLDESKDPLTQVSFCQRFIKLELAKEAFSRCKHAVKCYSEDIEFTYNLFEVAKNVSYSKDCIYLATISPAGETNKVYHDFDILISTINQISSAIKNNEMPPKLSRAYFMAINGIATGYIKHSGDKFIIKPEKISDK